MKPSRAAFVIGIAAVALGAGLAVVLWPSTDRPRLPRVTERERAVDSGEPELPAPAPESLPARTITPRPFDAPTEVQKAGPEAAAAAGVGEAAVISGQVIDFDRKPAGGVRVALFLAREEAPVSPPASRTGTRRDGLFSMTAPKPFPEDWVLVAHRPGRRPATLRGRGEPRGPLELVLGEGAAIEGTVSLDGKPAPEAQVMAAARSAAPTMPIDGEEVWWTGVAFEASRSQAVCDDAGRFRVTGLAEAEYQLDASRLGRLRLFGVNPRAVVRAPATGVKLEAATAQLRLKVTGEGKLLDRARVAMVAGDGRQLRADASEFADIKVAPGIPLTIDAAFTGFEPKSVPLAALGPGETRDLEVVLDPTTSPRLALRLQGATALGLKSVVVRFVSRGRPPENENRALQDLRQVLTARSNGDDDFVLERVPHPPGTYVLVVTATPSSFLIPIQKEVVLPAGGTLEVSTEAVAGGRFDVNARDPGGTPIAGEFVLRDLQGAEILTRRFGPGTSGASNAPINARPGEPEISRATGILAPGTYDLEVKCEGFKPVRRQVTVKPSALIVEDVRLERTGQ